MSACAVTVRTRRAQRGVGLVEILVSATLAGIAIAGALQLFSDSRNTYAIHETQARLQESARYALSVIEPDVRQANYWGLMKGSVGVVGAVAQTQAAGPIGAPSTTRCGTNFNLDLSTEIEGSNDTYALGCAALNNRPMPSADVLTIRRAAVTPTAVPANTVGPLRICSTRLSATVVNVANNVATCPAAPVGQVSDLTVNAYYVAQDSDGGRTGVPSLRRKALATIGGVPDFADQEIVSGVEDLQVQFGVDPTGNTGIATQYVDPLAAAALPVTAQIVSVRIWVLVRSDTPEVGFVDNRTYAYANRAVANGVTASLTGASAGRAYRPNDNFRRMLVSRTVMIRNALGT